MIEGGNRVDDAVWFGVEFARAGLDFLSLSKGGKFEDAKQPKVGEAAYPYTGPSGYECMPTDHLRRARPVRPQRAARRRGARAPCAPPASTTPIVAAGGIYEFEQAEAILAARRGRHRRRRAPDRSPIPTGS